MLLCSSNYLARDLLIAPGYLLSIWSLTHDVVLGASAQAAGVHKMKIQKIPFEDQMVSNKLLSIVETSDCY